MTAANLIRRRADPDDGRVWRLWLTPAGRAALAQSKAGLAEINARLTDGFTEAEIDVVARWLASMQTRFPREDE
jgi:DNA-binding MarR family transcriptional regulator